MRNIGCTHYTIIHECVHWDKHYKFFELQKLINPELTSISCKVVDQYKKGKDELSNELEWMEWQSSAIAPKILIPARTGRMKLNEILISLTHAFPNTRRAEIMQLAISEFANFFQVSTMPQKSGQSNWGSYRPPVYSIMWMVTTTLRFLSRRVLLKRIKHSSKKCGNADGR